MSESLIAKRYARALMRVVGESNMKEVCDQLSEITSLFDHEAIGKVLSSPVVPADLTIKVLENVSDQVKAPEDMKKFLKSVAKAGRIKLLPSIARAFQEIVDEKQNLVRATLKTAVEVDDAKAANVSDILAKKLGKTVQLDRQVDPSILGGMVVQIGNNKIDMSLKTKIDHLAQSALS